MHQIDDASTGFRVEVRGRLVRQHQVGWVTRARAIAPVDVARRKVLRDDASHVFQVPPLRAWSLCALSFQDAARDSAERVFHVLISAQHRDEVDDWKMNPIRRSAKARGRHLLTLPRPARRYGWSRRRLIETTEKIEQGRLPLRTGPQ